MARPRKRRRIEHVPSIKSFKPSGVPNQDLVFDTVTYEELESLRLKDIEGMENVECAERMQVSRSTFQRILADARYKVARALIEGRGLNFEGGDYHLATRKFQCEDCHNVFEKPFGDGEGAKNHMCKKCGKGRVRRIE